MFKGNDKETIRYLYSVINSLEDELMIIDPDYRIIDVNDAVLLNQRKSMDEVIGRYCYQVSHNKSRPCSDTNHKCPVKTVLKTCKPAQVTHIHTAESEKDKQKRYINIVATPVLDNKGNITAIVETMRDVTETVSSEMHIDQLNRELEEKDRIRGQLLNETFIIQEEERKRIARELHDETCQVIAGIAGQIEALASILPSNQEYVVSELRRIRNLHSELLGDINRLIYELRPSMLDDLGLDAAIRWLVEYKLEPIGIKVNVRIVELHNLIPPNIESMVFRVVQEAITNIARHSKAKNVMISIGIRRKTLRIKISDDGTGFDVKDVISVRQGPRGLGLQGMRERIGLLNGEISITSSAGAGTEITCAIPLEENK